MEISVQNIQSVWSRSLPNRLVLPFAYNVLTRANSGAPVIALLYQHASGARVRSTLALIYTFASLLILVALAVFGRFGGAEMLSGFALMPGFLAGYWVANRLRHRLDQLASRPVVLSVSTAAAIALLIRSIGS